MSFTKSTYTIPPFASLGTSYILTKECPYTSNLIFPISVTNTNVSHKTYQLLPTHINLFAYVFRNAESYVSETTINILLRFSVNSNHIF